MLTTETTPPAQSTWPTDLSSLGKFSVAQFTIAAAYVFFVFILRKTLPLEFLSVAWPASGLSLALLLRTRRRNVVGIWLGATISCVLIGRPVPVAMIIGLGNATGAWLGVTALRRIRSFDVAIGSAQSYFALVMVAGTIGSVLHAGAATFGFVLYGALSGDLIQLYFIRGWMANLMGAVLIAPVILSWWDDIQHKRLTFRPTTETVVLLTLTFLVGQIIFIHWFYEEFGHAIRGYWLFLLIAWIGIRVGIRGVEIALLMVAIQGLIAANHNRFLMATAEENQYLIYWFFMLSLAITGMAISTYFTERQRVLNQVHHMRKRLENVLDGMQCRIPDDHKDAC